MSNRRNISDFHSLKDIKERKYGKCGASYIVILWKMTFYFTYTLPEALDDFVTKENPVRVVDAFFGELEADINESHE